MSLAEKVRTPVVDQAELWERIDGDGDLLASLLDLYRHDVQTLLATIRTAVANQDKASLVMAAHTLKGATLTMAARVAGPTARELEMVARAGDFARARVLEQRLSMETAEVLLDIEALVASAAR